MIAASFFVGVKLVLAILSITAVPPVWAGTVRTVHTDERSMRPIYLKMGQSTVLRFDEKPKKVVVGNQNYFNVEFIENDITIQPQGQTKSNLFVYGEYETYGFILNVVNGNYDDLVYVKRRQQKVFIEKNHRKPKPVPKPTKKRFRFSMGIKKQFSLTGLEITFDPVRRLYILDMELKNVSSKPLDTSKVNLHATRSKKRLKNQSYAFLEDQIKPGKKSRVRFVIQMNQKLGFTLHLKAGVKNAKAIVSRTKL